MTMSRLVAKVDPLLVFRAAWYWLGWLTGVGHKRVSGHMLLKVAGVIMTYWGLFVGKRLLF